MNVEEVVVTLVLKSVTVKIDMQTQEIEVIAVDVEVR